MQSNQKFGVFLFASIGVIHQECVDRFQCNSLSQYSVACVTGEI